MKRLLPPHLFLLLLIGMSLICYWSGSPHNLAFPVNLIGFAPFFIGLALAVTGKNLFRRRRTNIMTFNDPDVLVTDGVFRFSRNPMYLGFAISMFGAALLTGAALSSFVITAVFVVIVDRWYIKFEEQRLEAMFADDFRHYKAKVRRWI